MNRARGQSSYLLAPFVATGSIINDLLEVQGLKEICFRYEPRLNIRRGFQYRANFTLYVPGCRNDLAITDKDYRLQLIWSTRVASASQFPAGGSGTVPVQLFHSRRFSAY